jgi:hypothetical protein
MRTSTPCLLLTPVTTASWKSLAVAFFAAKGSLRFPKAEVMKTREGIVFLLRNAVDVKQSETHSHTQYPTKNLVFIF